jgi:hypothetical protein
VASEWASSVDKDYDCELCVVGAGYAALNGLNAAAKYLSKGDRVIFIDKNETWGGQWTRQYDFVRLHQPYRMFTAGDQSWTLKRDRSHLATRREVLDHLASVPAVSAGHLEIKPLFGHAYTGHRIREGRAEIYAAPVSAGNGSGGTTRIRAHRLLKATGADIEPLPPFRLSSDRVRSVGVSDPVLMTPEFLEGDAAVHVIGSGKTAMDLVRHLVSGREQRRPVHLLIRASIQQVHRGHLVDVEKGAMILRDGKERREVPVADGSWFINCTRFAAISTRTGLPRRRCCLCSSIPHGLHWHVGVLHDAPLVSGRAETRRALALSYPSRRRTEAEIRPQRGPHGDGEHGHDRRPLAGLGHSEVPRGLQQVVPALSTARDDHSGEDERRQGPSEGRAVAQDSLLRRAGHGLSAYRGSVRDTRIGGRRVGRQAFNQSAECDSGGATQSRRRKPNPMSSTDVSPSL